MEKLPAEQKYLSLSHIVEPEGSLQDEEGERLHVFTIPTAETMTIEAAGPTEAQIYRGIFTELQGPPKTKNEVIAALDLENEQQEAFAEQVFDALSEMCAIVATTGLARSLTHTWQNPAPYTPQGFATESEAKAACEPRSVRPGEASYGFDVEPSFERASTREFDGDAPMHFRDLQKILVDSYRTSQEQKRPTPSPGGIYPVEVHVINHGERVVDDAEEPVFPAGVYQYDPYNLSLERHDTFDRTSGENMINHLAQDPDATDPSVWVTLSIDAKAFEQKYGNASHMFLGTSIGSTMQRIIEVADERGYGTLPVFGIQHHYADDILKHEGDVKTVLAIAVGKQSPEGGSNHAKAELADQMEKIQANTEGILLDSGRINFVDGRYDGMPNDFTGAWVKYAQHHDGTEAAEGYAFGTDVTYEGAKLKASAEALERVASGNIRIDKAMVSASELDAPWIDPRIAMPLGREQLERSGTASFSLDRRLNWTRGKRLQSSEDVYAPSEMIYYPYHETEHAVMYATSSGVAAYSEASEAIQRGLLELVERDAIMRMWIQQKSPSHLSSESAPESIAYRMRDILSRGNQVDLLDITQDNNVPAYLAVLRSETFPHFYTGAAAGFDPEKALHKALDEAVAGFTSRVASEEMALQEDAKKRAEGEFDVDSHGMLYAADPAQAKTLEWLFEGGEAHLPQKENIPSYEQLVERYNPAVFELDNPAQGNELKVVRVIAEDLIPIQFGEAGVPYKHHTLPEGTTPPVQPHFFN